MNMQIKWFAELVIIVVGILLALALDAWWESRQDRKEELETVLGIYQEFVQNRILLQESMAKHQQISDAAELVLDSEPTDCGEELEEAISVAVFHWKTFNPVRGATSSLIASGRMSLISDRALRNHLASWDGLVSDLAHDEQHAVEQHSALWDYIALNRPEYIALDRPETDCRDLVGDLSFKSLVTHRWAAESEILSEYKDVLGAIDRILAKTESFTP